jgi:hypothetical protein
VVIPTPWSTASTGWVFKRSGGWALRIEDLETGQASSEQRYESEDTAGADALLAVRQLRGKEPERLAGSSFPIRFKWKAPKEHRAFDRDQPGARGCGL